MLAATIILAGILHLGVPLLVVLFSYFALRQLYSSHPKKMAGAGVVHHRCGRNWRCRSLFYSGGHFGVAGCGGYLHSFGQRMGSEEADRLALLAILKVFGRSSSARLGRKQIICATWQTLPKPRPRTLVFSILGIVAAASLFFKTGLDPYRGTHRVKNNLYSICCDQVSTPVPRFLPKLCDRHGRADHHLSHQYRIDRDLSPGGSHAARAAAHCGHLSLRARADCRQPREQHNHRLCRVDDIPEDWRSSACSFSS